jgi:glycosyltransferase involved in cell wall biosynthesis
MNIGLNASALRAPLTGVGQYVHHIARGLLADSRHKTWFFDGMGWSNTLSVATQATGTDIALNATLAAQPLSLGRLVKAALPASVQSGLRRQVHQIRFTRGAKNHGLALYHEPNFLSFQFDGKIVLTVHDLSWIRFESTHPPERVRDMNRWFEGSLRRADKVITVSHFVKQELQAVFGLASERICVVPNGVEPLFAPREIWGTSASLEKFGLLPGRYWLSVGTVEPRKNLATTLDAFASLPADLRKRYPLVLVGPKGWGTDTLQKRIDTLVAQGEVKRLGFLSREDVAVVTAGAFAMVYPSLYEGFGLPPLEAMACGIPVLVSNVSSLPEVVGSAGIQVDPLDTAQLAAEMMRLMQDPAWHLATSKACLNQSHQFSWSRCVAETMQVYSAALNEKALAGH